MKYPIIFWVHSPIGYEVYLSFKSFAVDLKIDVKLFLTRNMQHEDAVLETNDNGLVWDQNANSQENTWKKLGLAIDAIISEHNGYTLCLPQSGLPYIEALIESPFCKGFSYYEEGTLNYNTDIDFKEKASRTCYKYKLNIGPEANRTMSKLRVSPQHIFARHLIGVSLLDFSHEKYLNSFAFFEEAFPGIEKTQIPITNVEEQISLRDTGIIIAPNFKLVKSQSSLSDYISSVKNIMKISEKVEWVAKLHPNQSPAEEDQFSKLINAKKFSAFIENAPKIANRETAFLDLGVYVTPSNSTLHYLKQRNQNNFIIVDYPKT